MLTLSVVEFEVTTVTEIVVQHSRSSSRASGVESPAAATPSKDCGGSGFELKRRSGASSSATMDDPCGDGDETQAIQSLDSLNEQIVRYVLRSPAGPDDSLAGAPQQRPQPEEQPLQGKKQPQRPLPGANTHEAGVGRAGEATGTLVGGGHEQQVALQSSMALMRRLLVDAQAKFRNMMDDNKALASRIDGDLQQAHQEVSQLRAELQDTNSRISSMAAAVQIPSATAGSPAFLCSNAGYASPSPLSSSGEPPPPPAPMSSSCPPNIPQQIIPSLLKSCPRCQEGLLEDGYRTADSEPKAAVSVQTDEVTTTTTTTSGANVNGGVRDSVEEDDGAADCLPLEERLQRLQEDKRQLAQHNLNLQKELDELRAAQAKQKLCALEEHDRMQAELSSARDALSALKQDRKRLKAEKFDLLNQMKQLYGTLEDKEKELRDFIRNYEQRMHDSDHSLKQLAQEREECDRERWNLLKHARDEAERSVALRAQLGIKEAHIKQLQEQLQQVQEKLTYLSDVESLQGVAGSSNGFQQGALSRRSCRSPAVGSEPPVVTLGYDSSPSHHAASSGSGAMDSPKKSPVSAASASALPGLSRSAEEIYQSSGSSDASTPRGAPGKPKKRRDGRSPWGSISRVFLRARQRKALEPALYGTTTGPESSPQHHSHHLQLQQQRQRCSWSPQGGAGPSLGGPPLLTQEEAAEKLRLLEEAQGTPMERWKAPTVLAWLELALAMPQYGPMCAENVKSGKILLELSDAELEAGLGITNVMHRRKLRLAIEEHREPSICPYPKMCLVTHTWVCGEWLSSLGLSAHADNFRAQLVDGRVLDTLSRRDLEKRLGMANRHEQTSLLRGVQLLRALRFDLRALAHRRAHCRHLDVDPLVWTNQRFIQWARSIDLGEYAENLRDSGVHGALVVLEPSFTADTMAQALGIPVSKNIIRRHLTTELENLVQPARMSLEAEAVVESKRSGERLSSATGSLGRSFGRSRARSSERGASDKRRSSIRDSLGRVLGFNSLPKPSTSGLGSYNVTTTSVVMSKPPPAPRVFRPSTPQPQPRPPPPQQHRRVFSQGTIETLTVTPV
ncbi:kazrin isoform X1 [Dermacentor andersoni]|uniref:kazrin isoform X1 n=1 Tax=Dermacentor andersoni TaxID=34620 RepID=UPI00215586B4|nr:kazrin-like isoform X1 [Dermacentor andersoni]